MPKVFVRAEKSFDSSGEQLYVRMLSDGSPFGKRLYLVARNFATDFQKTEAVTHHYDLLKQCFRGTKLVVEVEEDEPPLTATEVKLRWDEAVRSMRDANLSDLVKKQMLFTHLYGSVTVKKNKDGDWEFVDTSSS